MIGEASQWTLQDTHYIRTHYKWNLIKNQTRKQNITRNIEIKNNLTVTRGERGKAFSGTTIKDTWTKPRVGWGQGMEVGMAAVGEVVGEKCRQLYLNNNKKKSKKKKNPHF